MTEPTYPTSFGQQVSARSNLPPDLARRADEIEGIETTTELTELTGELISRSSWIDYVDLVLKALLVVAAFVIAARL